MSAPEWMARYGAASGAPIVFLHGFMGSARSVEPLLPHLAGHAPACVVAPHLPGHHPQAPVSPTFEGNVDWLVQRLRAAGLGLVHLVGYSLGARTALGLALTAPDLVGRLTLIGVHPGLALADARAERRRLDAERAARLRRDGLPAFVAHWESLPLFASQSAAQVEAQREIRLAHEVEGLAASLEHLGLGSMPELGSRCGELGMPVRLVAGALDRPFVAVAGELAARTRGLELEVVSGAGHNVVLEAPERLARLLTD
ncbi:MAG TPA: alpha/beta fold hydrolase [Kofleriaceae bacterium]|nr:alpha/beta fold hydrolase [Kofleriaceae bacterium]